MSKIVNVSDYMIFFDDVRVDQYVIHWSTNLGLFASDANASITMFRTDEMDKWKAYLTQVRIFTRNIFTGKFAMVFEGEIANRSWNGNRSNMGQITFQVKGYYHWLDVPIPMMISSTSSKILLITCIWPLWTGCILPIKIPRTFCIISRI